MLATFLLAIVFRFALGVPLHSRFCEAVEAHAMDEEDRGLLPSVSGILNCLKALAEEAAALNLHRTLSAIEDAFEAAATESGLDTYEDFTRVAAARPMLH
jgi:hypothetical protein